MGISQGSRLVSTNAASGPLLLGLGLPGARSGMPCARGPPCVTSPEAVAALPRWPAAARYARNPLGEDLPAHMAINGERRCANIASPERRTRRG